MSIDPRTHIHVHTLSHTYSAHTELTIQCILIFNVSNVNVGVHVLILVFGSCACSLVSLLIQVVKICKDASANDMTICEYVLYLLNGCLDFVPYLDGLLRKQAVEIHYNDFELSSDQLKMILQATEDCMRLEVVDFSGSEHAFAKLAQTTDSLPSLPKLRVLRLRGKNTTQSVPLLMVFSNSKSVKHVHMRKCTPEVLKAITWFPRLEKLSFDSEGDRSSALALSELLRSKLVELEVAGDRVRVYRSDQKKKNDKNKKKHSAKAVTATYNPAPTPKALTIALDPSASPVNSPQSSSTTIASDSTALLALSPSLSTRSVAGHKTSSNSSFPIAKVTFYTKSEITSDTIALALAVALQADASSESVHVSLAASCSLYVLSQFALVIERNKKLREFELEHHCLDQQGLGEISLDFARAFRSNASLKICALKLESMTRKDCLVIGSAFGAEGNSTVQQLELVRPSYEVRALEYSNISAEGLLLKCEHPAEYAERWATILEENESLKRVFIEQCVCEPTLVAVLMKKEKPAKFILHFTYNYKPQAKQ